MQASVIALYISITLLSFPKAHIRALYEWMLGVNPNVAAIALNV